MMSQSRSSSVVALALLFTLVAAPKPTAAFRSPDPILAQSGVPEFPFPDSIPTGTTVRIDGSNSMAAVNQALKQRFEADYSGTDVALSYSTVPDALQALLDGEIDLAAIGRPLTEEERSQGFNESLVGRHKIAIIVSEENPFNENLTFEQFAQIFRGEITDWSEVGGEPGPIRFVDHPDSSDTRQTLAQYDVFQGIPFESGATADPVGDDSVETITEALGADGISYITADQVFDRPGVRIISMHNTLPDDPRYPYSQPMVYVYRDEANPAVASFLGFATAAPGLTAIQEAGLLAAQPITDSAIEPEADGADGAAAEAGAAATGDVETGDALPPAVAQQPDPSPEAPPTVADPAPETAQEDDRAGAGWLWWLIPLLIGIPLLGWLLKGRRTEQPPTAVSPSTAVPVAPPPAEPPSGTLAERTGTVVSADRTSVAETPPAQVNGSPAASAAASAAAVGGAALVGAGAIAAGMAAGKATQPNRIVLVPRTSDQAYAYWETPEENRAALKEQGGQRYALRIYDVTGLTSEQLAADSLQAPFQEYQCDEAAQDRHVPIAQPDRDYLAEIGYLTNENDWLLLARSNSIKVPAPVASVPTAIQTQTAIQPPPPSVATAVGIAATAAAAVIPSKEPKPNRIVLVPRTPAEAYAYWETPEENKVSLKEQGGRQYTLRICDVTGIDLERQAPHLIQQYACDETATDRHVTIPQPDREYIAEIGYQTDTKDWLLLARSSPVHVPDVSRDTIIQDTPPVVVAPNGDQEVVEAAKFNVGQSNLQGEELADVDACLPELPDGYGESQIVLLPRDPHWAYTYWDIPIEHREAARQQGGTRLALRFYDVTSVNLDYQNPHSLQQYDCEEFARDWYLPVPVSDRDYIVEIGYLTNEGQWLMLARSVPVRIPPVYPSDWLEEKFLNVDWDDNLREKDVHKLVPPDQRTSFDNPIYDRIFSMAQSAEAQRLAGSLYGSMQQVPQQAVSSYAFPSGVGMSGVGMSGVGMSGIGMMSVPTMSGVGMSGVGMMGVPTMSGVGMSGVGMYSMSGVGMSGVGMMGVPTMSGVGMSGVGMYSMSGVGMSGVGMMSVPTMSGIGMMSGVGMSGVGMYSMSGVGMSGVGMSIPTMSGIGMMSGVGMSGVGMYSMSGVGMSGVGMMSVPTMSGVGMSGVGMMSVPTMSGVGMSGVGMGVPTMSGAGMSGVGFAASMPPIRPRKFWLVANAELIVHGATEPDATLMVGERLVQLDPDGTFRFQVAFPDGDIRYPILAIAADGEQNRSIQMDFNRITPVRYTNTKEEAVEEWLQGE